MNSIVFMFLALLLSVFTFLVPPFQKPDEPVHFYRIITLFQGQLTCDYSSDRPHFRLPQSVYDFPKIMGVESISMSTIKFPVTSYKKAYPWTGDRQVINE